VRVVVLIVLAVVLAVAQVAAARAQVAVVRDVFGRGQPHSELHTVDPRSLAQTGPTVPLDGYLRGWVRSPGGGRLALGTTDRGRLQIVDLRTARTTARTQAGGLTAWSLLAWPRARMLLAVGYGRGASHPMIVVDPARGTVLHRSRISGSILASAPTGDGLALLVAAPDRIAAAVLVLIDVSGRQRTINLPGIVAGQVPPASDNELARSVTPGLAVRDGVAFVASATESAVLEVVLASGRTTRHPLDPAAWGAPGEGSQREIAAIGPRQLAVSGVDIAADGTIRPIGLRLLDPRTWRTHVVDRDSSGFTALPEGGLGTFANAGPPRGLLLTDRSGHRAHTVLHRHVLVQIQRRWVSSGHANCGVVIRTAGSQSGGLDP
jgi:hypothetical protein